MSSSNGRNNVSSSSFFNRNSRTLSPIRFSLPKIYSAQERNVEHQNQGFSRRKSCPDVQHGVLARIPHSASILGRPLENNTNQAIPDSTIYTHNKPNLQRSITIGIN